jgi:hypothetical protein
VGCPATVQVTVTVTENREPPARRVMTNQTKSPNWFTPDVVVLSAPSCEDPNRPGLRVAGMTIDAAGDVCITGPFGRLQEAG